MKGSIESRKIVELSKSLSTRATNDIHATNYADTFDISGFDSNSRYQNIAYVTGVRRGGKGERRARDAREDRTREDRGRGPPPLPKLPRSLILATFPPLLRPAMQATRTRIHKRITHQTQQKISRPYFVVRFFLRLTFFTAKAWFKRRILHAPKRIA